MKRFDNCNAGGTIGNFIIPKKAKIEDDKLNKINLTTQNFNNKTGCKFIYFFCAILST
jgi:hypothetical protein